MELELKIPCACHQAKITICCQMPLVAPIAPKNCTGGFFSMLNPNFPSDLLSDHSSNTSFNAHSKFPTTVPLQILMSVSQLQTHIDTDSPVFDHFLSMKSLRSCRKSRLWLLGSL